MLYSVAFKLLLLRLLPCLLNGVHAGINPRKKQQIYGVIDIRPVDNDATNFPQTLTCTGIEDGNIGELVQLIELDVSLSLFTIMIYL